MNDGHAMTWRLILAVILSIVCIIILWALTPLYPPVDLLIGIGLPSAAAWTAASYAIRRGWAGLGSYAAAWGMYALAGTVFWEIIWDFYPVLLFWKPLMCSAFQGPSWPCTVAEYARERGFWTGFGIMLLLLPHSTLSGLMFVLRSFLPDYRSQLSD
jgi:hypothetical protein